MAERQQVFRWVRDLLAAGLVALTVTTLTVTTIQDVDTISGANTGGTGSCELDVCSSVADEINVEVTTARLCAGEGSASIMCDADASCLRYDIDTVCVDNDGVTFDSSGQTMTIGPLGITVNAAGVGDDVLVAANDTVTLTADGGALVGLVGSGVGWLWSATDTGQDIQVTAADTLALTSVGGFVDIQGFTSAAMGVPGGGGVTTNTAGISLTATTGGDDIDIDADATSGHVELTGGGASLLLNNAGAVLATAGADTLTLNSDGLQATIEDGGLAYHLGGQQLGVFSTFTPTGTGSYELAWQWSLPAGALATAGHGWSLDWSFQVAQNTNEKLVKITAGSPTCTCASPTLTTPLNSTSASCSAGASRVELVAYTAALQRVRHSTMCQVASGSLQAIVGDVESGLNAGLTPANAYQFCLCAQATTTNTDTNLVVGVLNWL